MACNPFALGVSWFIFIFNIPYFIVEKRIKYDGYESNKDRFSYSFGILLLIIAIYCVGVEIVGFFIGWYDKQSVYYSLGGIDVVVMIVILIVFIIDKLDKRIKNKRKEYESKPNILFEFIKSKYKKSCKRINWIEEK